MDWDDAYAIQDRILAAKLKAGARVAGYKAGLTSHAKMKQMGVTDPVFGFLVDEFTVPDGGEVKVGELIHPKVEPRSASSRAPSSLGPAAASPTCSPRATWCCRASKSSTAATAISSSI